MKFISIDTTIVNQLDQVKKCALCAHDEAMWSLTNKDHNGGYYGLLAESVMQYTCSLCLFYQTEWGRDHADDLVRLIENANKDKNRYELSETNELKNNDSANKLLSAIYLSNKVLKLFSK